MCHVQSYSSEAAIDLQPHVDESKSSHTKNLHLKSRRLPEGRWDVATPPNRTPGGEKGTAPLWRHLGAASKWRPEKLFYRIKFANETKIRDENLSTYHCDLKKKKKTTELRLPMRTSQLIFSPSCHNLCRVLICQRVVSAASFPPAAFRQPSRWAAMPSEQTLDLKYMCAFTTQPLWRFPRKSVWCWHTNRKLLSSEPGCLIVTSPVFNVTVAMFILCSLWSHNPKSSAGSARLHSPAFPIPSH